ncbi:hypothetical protein [Allopontixanthobacter sp.]|uniref:hypothetical protein n=1 Tax=Allopontixanthobacter sp. TaxID=2906452 RepID=UPI002AB94A4D|nr:hypothetical protein [Allopontixanthobacter sp.]MDZ4307711.1 hypothetical protein [Allopontixanthobacter sp.]
MTEKLHLKPAIWAGIIAGIVFVMMEMALIAAIGNGMVWGPPRMMAAIVMGKGVLPPPATFDFAIVMVGMMVHFVLSVILGIVLGWIIAKWRLGMAMAIIVGLVFGLLVYLVNFYVLTGVFPWFANARNMITLVSHLVFGGVLGAVYRAMAPSHAVAERTGDGAARGPL